MTASKLVTAHSIAGLLLAALALGSSAALAAPPASDGPRIEVSYDHLDLATRHGLEALHRQIVSASRTVCPAPKDSDLRFRALARECRMQAIEAALRSIGNAELAALHAASRDRG